MNAPSTRFELVGCYGRDLESLNHSMLGLNALVREMADQGVPASELLHGAGVSLQQLGDSEARMSHRQKITILSNAHRLSARPDVGLRAGCRQRLSDFGVLGYATAASATFGDAVIIGMKHLRLIGPVLEKRFTLDGGVARFEGRDVLSLGPLLPMATEFWLSSTLRLATEVLGRRFPSLRLKLPYARPSHADAYHEAFGCEIQFEADALEWSFDAALMRTPCPQANPYTADLCQRMCERIEQRMPQGSELARAIHLACVSAGGQMPSTADMAARLGVSVRSLHRRLAAEGLKYQEIVDRIRLSVSSELLSSTDLPVNEIAVRVGFSEEANFRRAFRRWTGVSPAAYRIEQARTRQ